MQLIAKFSWMDQKDTTFDHDFYFVVGKQCRKKMRTQVTNTISLYKLIYAILLLIFFKVSYEIDETLSILKFILIFKKIFWNVKNLKLT